MNGELLSEGKILERLRSEGVPGTKGDIFELERLGRIKGYVFGKKATRFCYEIAKIEHIKYAREKRARVVAKPKIGDGLVTDPSRRKSFARKGD